jgi:hypothetical protein
MLVSLDSLRQASYAKHAKPTHLVSNNLDLGLDLFKQLLLPKTVQLVSRPVSIH